MSRKVTVEILRAFDGRQSKTIGNTRTDGDAVYLHGNKIIERRDGHVWITNAGWPTPTTKERLNGLYGIKIKQTKGQWYLNGNLWNGEWVDVWGLTSL